MKPHFLSSLIYVLLVILLIPGMTPHMASAADNTSGDSGSSDAEDSVSGDSSTGTDDSGTDGSTYDSIDDLIDDLIDDTTDDSVDDTTDDSTGDTVDDSNDDSTTDNSVDNSKEDSGKDNSADDSGKKNSAESKSSSSSASPSPSSNSNSSSSSSSSSSDSDSGPSSMGSGISTEPATNIDVKELATRNVISGYHIEYSFPENVTCITHIEYDAIRTFRKTTAIVEVLKGKSTLVPTLPQGVIYKHVNIWIGENAAGLPTSLKNGIVGFRVEKDWIKNNNVSESNVTLQRYDKDEDWMPLDTKKTGEDEKYVYFESQTPGYSFFAITDYNVTEEKQETQIQKTLRTLTGKDNGIAEGPMKVAKVFIAIALPLFMIIAGYSVLKKKI